MIVKRNIEYRLYPTKKQITLMDITLDRCRWMYNKILSARIKEYGDNKKCLSKFDCNKLITQWKHEDDVFQVVHSQVLQNIAERVDLAFLGFFRRLKLKGEKAGFPRFKSKGRYDSFCYPQHSGKWWDCNKLNLGKIGKVKVKKHREYEGTCKRLTIKKKNNKWYAVLTVEQELTPIENTSNNQVGIDLGVKTFITLSDGNTIDSPKHYNKTLKTIKRYNRQVSTAKTKQDKTKYRKRLHSVHTKIANQRKDFHHKVSRMLVNQYSTIVIEDLNTKNMMSQGWHHLNRHIMDVSWCAFIQKLSYKAEEAGCQIVKVNPAYTSKICSGCGTIVNKELSERIHKCDVCGLELDRDLNAARNILRLGLQSLGNQSIEVSIKL